ncbi:MAG TPA: hypothetical protein DEP48_07120 [Persephonella sp.]|uniref:Uncharacterized protein n=1 Tax=Persephonella marina (strain DSM 14350 / EX-H1) TaxID=123214 RepID=C0QUA3_PERMH|nr:MULTISPECIES: hypothetical protein [Persephonella]ACO04443.1 hypothetical protein PERMA_0478 [Persephonella marina EX-H1]HCB70114.1 hypothetical protein [Persephonella sp.]
MHSNRKKIIFFSMVVMILLMFKHINQKHPISLNKSDIQKKQHPSYRNLIKVDSHQIHSYKKTKEARNNYKHNTLPVKIKLHLSKDVIFLLLNKNSKVFVFTGRGKNSSILGYLDSDLRIKELSNIPDTIIGYQIKLLSAERRLIYEKNYICNKLNCKLFLQLDPRLKIIIQNLVKKEIKNRNISKIVSVNVSLFAQKGYLYLTIDSIQLEGKKIPIKKVYPI